MNNFNTVFRAVKEQCGKAEKIEGSKSFEAISTAANIPAQRLDFYLETLESVGLIKYSIEKWFIQLTPYGKVKDRIFAD
jgi:hypothetical protein